MKIREAGQKDFDDVWPFFHEVVSSGDTYAYDPEIAAEEAYRLWFELPLQTYVAEDDGRILGTYHIRNNQSGPGSHVCNCAYMVSKEARGRGVATQMCEHSQVIALELGFRAMQFNLVVETNAGAVRLWQQLGFDIVGTIPKAFLHPTQGYVGAHVMYKWLLPE
jgi:RimJ/RimL family protein N-acetyltransferase